MEDLKYLIHENETTSYENEALSKPKWYQYDFKIII